MALDVAAVGKLLAGFEFKELFIEELGWNRHDARLEIAVDGQTLTLSAVAEKCGMAAFVCSHGNNGQIPGYPTRRRIERQVARSAHEHLIIFMDGRRTAQVWQWVRRERGKPAACREHTYHAGQPGDSLIQKLNYLHVSLEEEEGLTIIDVGRRVKGAFDVERVTKRFYDRFKTEHAVFLKFLEGIPDEEMERWYVSVMLNRLMFIYFIQKKGFLDNDRDYLKNKLVYCRRELGKDRYYRDLLCLLFFEGFAKRKEERSDKARELLGEVPYLNGGIFMPHKVEEDHGEAVLIPDRAFEKLFEFFDAYQWHLDERPLKRDNEINPDVLGYIFEKYINQKQMGAYYTKEDITEYISKNTVIPFLFDAAREKCKVPFDCGTGVSPVGNGQQSRSPGSVWQHLREDPDRYIYSAVKHGVELPLPPEIEEGLYTSKPNLLERRKGWNRPALSEYALPTEIWREVVARRKRYEEVRSKLAAGEVHSINDLITYNLDIRQFAQDVIENCEGPELLVAFWKAIESVTVLDPACGSGAFLFAALNILEPLYEACLERMRFFLEEWAEGGKKTHPNYYKLFTETLKRMEEHPNHRYFVLKSIIVNNLYGVDIMEEAVEICKLRLFLKLVAQIERVEEIEPLPDIDFNIRAGNTLVGFASLDEVRKTLDKRPLGFLEDKRNIARIEEAAVDVDRLFVLFRQQQTELGGAVTAADKEELGSRLRKLTDELDLFLAGEYGIDCGAGFQPASLEDADKMSAPQKVCSAGFQPASLNSAGNMSAPQEVMQAGESLLTLGSCVLRQPEIAAVVQDALLHFEGERYHLSAWSIMPNHVHVVLTPVGGHVLSDILHSWKSFTSKVINKVLKRSGQLWERESFDHLIRSVDDWEKFVFYVKQNPVDAGFCQRPEDWPFSSCGAGFQPAVNMEFVDPRKTPFAPMHGRGDLPHLYKEGGTYFLTFRLADAVVFKERYAGKMPAPQGVCSAGVSPANPENADKMSTPQEACGAGFQPACPESAGKMPASQDNSAFERWRKSHRPFHWFAEFYGILKAGGFDVIIGNPPYVEYSKVKDEYMIQGYTTEECGNLYAFVIERSLSLVVKKDGHFGIIVPVAITSTRRMEKVRLLLSKGYNWISSFADRPSCAFTGVHQCVSIIIWAPTSAGRLFTSRFVHWSSNERNMLFAKLLLSESQWLNENAIPLKSDCPEMLSILMKLLNGTQLQKFESALDAPIYICAGTGGYWLRTLLTPQSSRKYRERVFRNSSIGFSIAGLLNSTAFYMLWRASSNCRDLMLPDIFRVRVPESLIASADAADISRNQLRLLEATIEFREGKMRYDQYRPAQTKLAIDEIDGVLARHYGFTDEELDFIINYDIKYRMGQGEEAGEA